MAEESKVVAKNVNANPNPNQMTTYIILGLIALLIIFMVGAIFIFLRFSTMKFPKTIIQTVPTQEHKEVTSGHSEKFGLLVPLNEFVISLAVSGDGGSHYLKTNVTLEIVEDEKVKEEMDKRVPQFRDLILSIGNSMTIEELEKKEGKDTFRSEILRQINSTVGSGKVRNVFFTEYYLVTQ